MTIKKGHSNSFLVEEKLFDVFYVFFVTDEFIKCPL